MKRRTRTVETRCFDASIAAERGAQQFLSDQLERSSMPSKERNEMRLAVEELFTNVAKYAYGSVGGTVDMTVQVDNAQRRVTVLLSDSGVAFDPFAEQRNKAQGPLDALSVGGLGILIAVRLMDECSYCRKGDRNETTIVKVWDDPDREADAVASAAQAIGTLRASARDAGAFGADTGDYDLNALERSQNPLTEDDLAFVVGGLMLPATPSVA